MSNEMTNRKVGRPLKFPSVEELQKKIDDYFDDRDATGKPYTITGLALWLDASSRECLLNYQEKDDYFDTITRAKLRCQEFAESQLYTAKSSNGPIFALKNYGWSDARQVDIQNTTKTITVTMVGDIDD